MTNLYLTTKVSHKKKVIAAISNGSGVNRNLLAILKFLKALLVARKDKPMPQSNVWKQAAKGLEIFINATNYRKDM